MLTGFTAVGADDSVEPAEMLELQRRFGEKLEFGILFGTSEGRARYPSSDWQKHLVAQAAGQLRLSGHLCGRYVRATLAGRSEDVEKPLAHIWPYFSRIQLNLRGHRINFSPACYIAMKKWQDEGKWLIFQCGHEMESQYRELLIPKLKEVGILPQILFDSSGGNGLLPAHWPGPIRGIPCGYSGGLNPSNIALELARISLAAKSSKYWVDAESGIRSDDEHKLLCDVKKIAAMAEAVVEAG